MDSSGDSAIGELEIQRKDGEYDIWTIIKRGRLFVIGTPTNTGLLSEYYYKMEPGETVQNALQEVNADLEVLATDGESYMSRVKKVPKNKKIPANALRGLRRNEGEGKIESEGKRRLRERLQKPSTSFEFIVQGYYPGSGWEDLTTADNYWEALQDKKAYEENERQYAHRLIKRRIKKISTNRRRGLRRNPGTTKVRPIPGMFYRVYWSHPSRGETAPLIFKGEQLLKLSISDLSRYWPLSEGLKMAKVHFGGPFESWDSAFMNG